MLSFSKTTLAISYALFQFKTLSKAPAQATESHKLSSLVQIYVQLTLRGKTSLLIPKKTDIALVHEHRPATLPQTFLAVSNV